MLADMKVFRYFSGKATDLAGISVNSGREELIL